ncbi:hypothetical protein [Pseudomonas phage PA1C]|uniref:SH3 fold domain-containing protein n=2 Tax=root TaxID=1 RepID=A0A5C1K772_9CAUD|nr:hypothetical protein PP933_gp047 [Pseudomonas phage vB_PaeM_PS119XW]QBX32199.1 hypothetical protein [Pseudomonas phage PA1C]QEM41776.1 hypothetical protein [Pseudomonas phage vB_PaeM_PS119XW]BEG72687.1 hypothetical protein RVBP21_3150 [Pseudomonas phage BRkr]
MPSIRDVAIGQKISFEVYPSAQYGNNFKNVTLAAFLDANLVRILGFDLIAAHQNVYPTLPAGTPNDPSQYSYVRVEFEGGQHQYIGIPWIREGSVVVNNGQKATLVFQNIDQRRLERIIEACKMNNEVPDSVVLE